MALFDDLPRQVRPEEACQPRISQALGLGTQRPHEELLEGLPAVLKAAATVERVQQKLRGVARVIRRADLESGVDGLKPEPKPRSPL